MDVTAGKLFGTTGQSGQTYLGSRAQLPACWRNSCDFSQAKLARKKPGRSRP